MYNWLMKNNPKPLSFYLLTFLRISLICTFCVLLNGCSIFSSSKISGYAPVQYDGSPASKVLKTAMSQVGKKYSYGKATPSEGFDCSGLIYWSYKRHGITLPRHTSHQAKAGTKVSRWKARQGDIVVFKIGRRLHTGLLADKGRFLHAPSSGGRVRLEPLNNPYWKPKIIGYRRIIN